MNPISFSFPSPPVVDRGIAHDQGIDIITFKPKTGELVVEGWYDQLAHWGAGVIFDADQRRELAASLLEGLER